MMLLCRRKLSNARLLQLGGIWLLLCGAAPALAQNPGGHEPPSVPWLIEQAANHDRVDLNQRCDEKRDPVKDADDRGVDLCRTIAANDLRQVLLSDQLPQQGIRLVGAYVNGKLDLKNTTVKKPVVILSSRIDGGVDLTQTRLDGPLNLNDTLVNGPMAASGLHASKDVSAAGVRVKGRVDLRDANIDGSLQASEATFDDAIDATRLQVSRHFFMVAGVVKGGVKFRDARIGGNFDVERSNFEKTLDATRLKVTGNVFMNNHGTFNGKITLDYALIEGDLEMEGHSTFGSISGESLRVSHHMFMGGGTVFRETVYLPYLHVGGYLDLRQGAFVKIDLSGSSVGQELRLSSFTGPREKPMDVEWRPLDSTSPVLTLRNAQAGTLHDSVGAWPDRVDLDGFTYARLGAGSNRTVEQWNNWLKKSTYAGKRFNPQPYTYLAKVLNEAGNRDEGQALQFAAREGERRQALADRNWGRWIGLSVLRWLCGYGIGVYTFIVVPWVICSVAVGVIALRFSRVACAKGILWCTGASMERLLPIAELNKEFSEFFYDPQRERLRPWQLAFFGFYGLWGWVLGLVLIAAMSGLTQGP
jgi:hypothetical protein